MQSPYTGVARHCLEVQILVYSKGYRNDTLRSNLLIKFECPGSFRAVPIPEAELSPGLRRQGLIFGLDATQILLVFLVPFVAFWTARTALARNRNPWLWGGAAFVLGIPWPGINLPILGVVPVLFLMFFVRPTAPGSVEPRNACSKCASSHPPGQNFCTKCGWDLSREYSAETADTVLASEMHQHQASPTTMERTTETATQDPFGTAPSTPDEDLLSATGNDQYEAPVTGMPTGEPVAEGTPAFASEKLQPEG